MYTYLYICKRKYFSEISLIMYLIISYWNVVDFH